MKTYKDIINLLITTTEDLYNDKITIDKAKQICQNTQTLINAAKLHLEVCKALKIVDKVFFNTENSEPLIEEKKDIITNLENDKNLCLKCKFEKECEVEPKCNADRFDHFKLKK